MRQLLILLSAIVVVGFLPALGLSQGNILVNGDFSDGCEGWTFTDVSWPYYESEPWATMNCSEGYAAAHLHEMYGAGLQTQPVPQVLPHLLSFDYWGLVNSDRGIMGKLFYGETEVLTVWLEHDSGGGYFDRLVVYYMSEVTIIYVNNLTPSAGHVDVVVEGGEIIAYIDGEEVGRGDVPAESDLTTNGVGIYTVISNHLDTYIYYDNVVFEPTGRTTDVPAGDSIVVDAIPDTLQVVFDSVSTSGQFNADSRGTDPCPPPDGVTLMPDYYDLSTTAHFDYAAEVAITRADPLPDGMDLKYVRVFARPSGGCEAYRDITTNPPEEAGHTLISILRTKSEDDEFSVFVLGEDRRPPKQVVELKFDGLEGAIDAGQDTIPSDVLTRVRGLLDRARDAYYRGCSYLAAERADSIAAVVRATPAIPHTYDPEVPGQNLAGRLISDAHTLAFSLGFSAVEALPTQGRMVPACANLGRDGKIRAYLEVPEGLDAGETDPEHIYFLHEVRANPDSVSTGDYDGDGQAEIRAVFSGAELANVLKSRSFLETRITCFIGGYEVYSAVKINVLGVALGVLGEGPYMAGSTQRLTWEDTPCGSGTSVSLWFSSDAGLTWQLVASDIAVAFYDWTVPAVETRHGFLKVTCLSRDGAPATGLSNEFTITSSAGVEAGKGIEPVLVIEPNPSASSFAIELTLGRSLPADVRVYSILGQQVKALFSGEVAAPGLALSWQGDNDSGRPVSAGAYFVIARLDGRVLARKVVLQR